VLAGRNPARGIAHAELLVAADATEVSFVELDVLDRSACEQFLRAVRPDLVIQAACYFSPWAFASLDTVAVRGLRHVGFGVQLPFQAACVRSLMLAVREVGFAGPVVNCSYPDATNTLLAHEGLAPTIGVGNVGMMQARVEALLRNEPDLLVRMIAHHSQTVSVMTGLALPLDLQPRVYLGASGMRRDELAHRGRAFEWSIATNLLTAAVAVPVIRALLPNGLALRASVPGVRGLPGGYPVRITRGTIDLDLPPNVELEDAVAYNLRAGELDGIRSISDGVAYWTRAAEVALRAVHPALAEPLASADCLQRAYLLTAALKLPY